MTVTELQRSPIYHRQSSPPVGSCCADGIWPSVYVTQQVTSNVKQQMVMQSYGLCKPHCNAENEVLLYQPRCFLPSPASGNDSQKSAKKMWHRISAHHCSMQQTQSPTWDQHTAMHIWSLAHNTAGHRVSVTLPICVVCQRKIPCAALQGSGTPGGTGTAAALCSCC